MPEVASPIRNFPKTLEFEQQQNLSYVRLSRDAVKVNGQRNFAESKGAPSKRKQKANANIGECDLGRLGIVAAKRSTYLMAVKGSGDNMVKTYLVECSLTQSQNHRQIIQARAAFPSPHILLKMEYTYERTPHMEP